MNADEKPIISIVMGVLNGASMIEQAIDSFLEQSLDAKELVVMDGGSTDGTQDVLKKRTGDIAYWQSERDEGVYDAWNKAIAHCRGEYIGFVGCDDTFADSRALERLAARARANPDLICSLNALVDDGGNFVRVIGAPWNWAGMKYSMNLGHACLLHRADLFQRYGLFTTSYRIGADYEFLLRLGPETNAAFVDQVTIRVGANGMSHRLWRTTYYEHWHLQSRSPHVGLQQATRNLARNVSRFAYRKLRGRR